MKCLSSSLRGTFAAGWPGAYAPCNGGEPLDAIWQAVAGPWKPDGGARPDAPLGQRRPSSYHSEAEGSGHPSDEEKGVAVYENDSITAVLLSVEPPDRIEIDEAARNHPARGTLAGVGQPQHQRLGRDSRTMKTLLVTVLLAALLAAAPVSAQRTSRLHLGVTVTSMHGHVWENTMAGAYGGVSFDMRDYLRLGVLYVQKGRVWGDRLNSTGERVHSIEVPVLYKHTIAKNTHLLVGAAPSYDYYLDIGEVIGLATRAEDYPFGVEVAYVHGLVRDTGFTHGSEPGHRVLRIGVEIPLRAGERAR